MSVTWTCLHHRELDTATLYALLALRTQVFVVEQRCPYLETDGQDLLGDTCHLLAQDARGLMAYLRLLDGHALIGHTGTPLGPIASRSPLLVVGLV